MKSIAYILEERKRIYEKLNESRNRIQEAKNEILKQDKAINDLSERLSMLNELETMYKNCYINSEENVQVYITTMTSHGIKIIPNEGTPISVKSEELGERIGEKVAVKIRDGAYISVHLINRDGSIAEEKITEYRRSCE